MYMILIQPNCIPNHEKALQQNSLDRLILLLSWQHHQRCTPLLADQAVVDESMNEQQHKGLGQDLNKGTNLI